MSSQPIIQYSPDGVTFKTTQMADLKYVYAPLCGTQATSLKSAITPSLSGDIKIDKFHYLTKPAAREDLRYPMREFFIHTSKGTVSLSQDAENKEVTVGQIWHHVNLVFKKHGLAVSVTNFIPSSDETIELMKVTVTNRSTKSLTFTPTAAIPIFGRSLANKHDHEHVTALLNRIEQVAQGVVVEPTMAFNEEGHKNIQQVYYVFGSGIVGSFPTVDSFFGDEGSLLKPDAVVNSRKPVKLTEAAKQGKEAVGALRFAPITLKPKQSKDYIIAIGIAATKDEAIKAFARFSTSAKFDQGLEANKLFWATKVGSIDFKTGDTAFNGWMRWVTLQPVLRRIFGCSFLPDHDYGKGGKGWRDIWQDLLSLILIEPEGVRENLINNCAGIRIDGSNATIIGSKPGEFIADRNAITRVWMDHGCWPLMTLSLYVQQTGDTDILFKQQTYFRDPQLSRTFEKDLNWASSYGNKLLDQKGQVYQGTLIEHVLVSHLTQFFNVGAHNLIRLESADWNDGLDMAFARGESVAFSSFYAGNLLHLADMVERIAEVQGFKTIKIAKELLILLDTLSTKIDYDNIKAKQTVLFGKYFKAVQPVVSGAQVDVNVNQLAADLRLKGQWLFEHIRRHEKVTVSLNGKKYQWFNGYYDNQSNRVEGLIKSKTASTVRMTLTGQVFALMSGLANRKEAEAVIESVNRFLKDKELGGYRLNSDFGVRHYLDLGRAFGFAYGTKENGAFFSHMIVMYAYALYNQGFAREGHRVLQSIYTMSANVKQSKIYPGIPEYFDSEGRGMYHYLTGSASWLVLTQLTKVFGVRGAYGDLILHPQLVKEEFDRKGLASVRCQFAGKPIEVKYHLVTAADVGTYRVNQVTLNGTRITPEGLGTDKVVIQRHLIQESKSVVLEIRLG